MDIVDLDPKTPGLSSRRVRLKVLEAFAGIEFGDAGDVEVYTTGNSAACGYPFTRGGRYLVFAYESSDGTLTVSICSPTRHMGGMNGDLKYLRALKAAGHQIGRLKGRATYVEGSPSGAGPRPRPFVGARIFAHGDGRTIDVVSDREGRFEILAPPGKYTLDIQTPDGLYAQRSRQDVWILDPESCGEIAVRIHPDGHVSGRVVTADGVPIAHIAVKLGDMKDVSRLGSSYGKSARTDALGRFRLEKLPPGQYALGLLIPQLPDKSKPQTPVLMTSATSGAVPWSIDVTVGGRVDVGDFVVRDIPKLVTISGIVVDLSSQPVRSATVEIVLFANRRVTIASVPTDDSGRFAFAAIAGAKYALRAQLLAWLWGSRSEQLEVVAAADSPPITITLAVRDRVHS
jgi:Carboxypeptidase regulatory-like domain